MNTQDFAFTDRRRALVSSVEVHDEVQGRDSRTTAPARPHASQLSRGRKVGNNTTERSESDGEI